MPTATGGASPSSIQAALMETWTEKQIADQLYQQNPTLAAFKRLNKTQIGEYAQTPIHTERNWGYTVTPQAGGALNDAGAQGYQQAKWYYTHQHVQVQIQGSAIDQSAGDANALASVIDMEVTGALNDLNRQLTRQLFMDGSGVLATVNGAPSGQIVTLSNGQAVDRGWIGVGARLAFGTAGADTSVAGGLVVASIDVSTPTAPKLTLTGTMTGIATTNNVYFYGSRQAGVSLEMNGLRNIVSATTLGGLDPTSPGLSTWQSSVDATAQAMQLIKLYDRNRVVAQKTGNTADRVVTSLKQQQALYNLVQPNMHYTDEKNMPVGDMNAVRINGVNVFADPDCQDTDMFFLTTKDLLLVSNGDPYWQNKITGGDKLSWIQGTDSYGGKITVRMQTGARRRNSQTALTGLS